MHSKGAFRIVHHFKQPLFPFGLNENNQNDVPILPNFKDMQSSKKTHMIQFKRGQQREQLIEAEEFKI